MCHQRQKLLASMVCRGHRPSLQVVWALPTLLGGCYKAGPAVRVHSLALGSLSYSLNENKYDSTNDQQWQAAFCSCLQAETFSLQ